MDNTRPAAFLVTASGTPELTREQTRTRRFVAPARGIRFASDTTDRLASRQSAAVLGSTAGAVLVDVAAAQAWQLPLPPWIAFESAGDPVAVSAPQGRNRPRRGDVRGRRLRVPAEHVTVVNDLRVTTPARTWLDCAERVPLPHLVAMGDVVLARNLAARNELTAVVSWARRRRGVVNARRALPVLDERAGSPGESLIRAQLVLEGVPRPLCNLNIVEGGEWLARADMAWPEARLIVEYDGLVHLDELQRRSDATRRNLLQSFGWLVITLTAADLARPWLMVAMIRSALLERRAPPR